MQLRDEDWDKVIAVNLTATFRLTRAAVSRMMRRRWGRVIAISSVVGFTGNPGQGNYTASKAGMVGMIKSVAAEYAKRNITANCIAPGLIASAMTEKLNEKQTRGYSFPHSCCQARNSAKMWQLQQFLWPRTRPLTSMGRPSTSTVEWP